jgi:hypothetical protein
MKQGDLDETDCSDGSCNPTRNSLQSLVRWKIRDSLGPAGANYGCPTHCRSSSPGRLTTLPNLPITLNGHVINSAGRPLVRGKEELC